MITTTCLIGVVVGGAWPACGVVLAAAAVIMAVTATAAPVTTAGRMSLLAMPAPFPYLGGQCRTAHRLAGRRTAYPSKRAEPLNRRTGTK
jgi:hypothetical protein